MLAFAANVLCVGGRPVGIGNKCVDVYLLIEQNTGVKNLPEQFIGELVISLQPNHIPGAFFELADWRLHVKRVELSSFHNLVLLMCEFCKHPSDLIVFS